VITDLILADERYAGFAGRVLGAYVGGILAEAIGPRAEVTLRRPVPTGSRLQRRVLPDLTATLSIGDTIVAEGRPGDLDIELPDAVSFEEAEQASARYPGHAKHLFPRCFVCGPARQPGDALRIFPGAVPGRPLVAAPWVPDVGFADNEGGVLPRIVWSACDCPALWALILAAPRHSLDLVVTGSIITNILGRLEAGQPHVVCAWPLGGQRRLLWAGAAVFTATGELRAVARQTCVRTDWGVPLGLAAWQA